MNGVFLWACIQQLLLNKPWGNNPMSDIGLILFTAGMFLLSIAMLSAQLKTYINKEGVYVQFFPFHFRYQFYDWNNIHNVYVRKYSPLRLGGWGLKFSMDASKYFTVSGNMGLQLILMNGRKILIGTKQPDKLSDVLHQLGKMEN